MKHTQGKWKVMHSTSPKGKCALAVWPDTTIEGSIGSPICKVSPIENVNETDEANAKLIAASPELLEACQWALKQFLILADKGQYPEHLLAINGGNGLNPLVNAIKKATKYEPTTTP